MKTCTKCGEAKLLEDFTPGQHNCKGCRNAYNRELYARNLEHNRALKRQAQQKLDPAKRREYQRRWRERHPDLARQYSTEASQRLRERDPDYFRNYYYENIEIERERARVRMERSRNTRPDLERERKRRYREAHLDTVRARERENTHRRRALKGTHSPELAALMAQLLKEPCAYCGSVENPTIDHIVPLSRGGRHEADNLAPACFSCNSSKGALFLEEWQPSIRRPT